MTLKQLYAAALLVTVPASALASWGYFFRIDDAKYRQGDCITPTDQSMSFYGHYARVEGVISFENTPQPGVYYLSFPVYESRTPLYAQTIDGRTERVDGDFCKRKSATP